MRFSASLGLAPWFLSPPRGLGFPCYHQSMAKSDPAIEVIVSVAQVKTLADGGIRIGLDLPEDAVPQAAKLMECKRLGVAIKATLVPIRLEP